MWGVSLVYPGDLYVRHSVLQLRTSLVCAREGELPSPASSRTHRTFHLGSSRWNQLLSQMPEIRVAQNSSGGRAAFSQHGELQHLSAGTDRGHSHVCSLLELLQWKLLQPNCFPRKRKDPRSRDLGFTVTLGAEEIDCKMCTITSTRHTEILSLLCEAQTVSDCCLRDCQS